MIYKPTYLTGRVRNLLDIDFKDKPVIHIPRPSTLDLPQAIEVIKLISKRIREKAEIENFYALPIIDISEAIEMFKGWQRTLEYDHWTSSNGYIHIEKRLDGYNRLKIKWAPDTPSYFFPIPKTMNDLISNILQVGVPLEWKEN